MFWEKEKKEKKKRSLKEEFSKFLSFFKIEKIKEKFKGLNFQKNKKFFLGLGASFVLLIVALLIFLPASKKNISLHVSDTWKNIGKVDDYLYFREDNVLYCYNKRGKSWEKALDSDVSICYGENVHVYKANGKWQVLDKKSGSLIYERDMAELLSIAVVPKGAYSDAELLGIKKEGFVIFDKDYKVKKEQHTRGLPMSYSSSKNGEIWTSSGPMPGLIKEGFIEKNIDPPAMIAGLDDVKRNLLVMEKDNKEIIRLSSASAFKRPSWTGEDSFVVANGDKLYFIKGQTIKNINVSPSFDFIVSEDGIYVLSNRKLYLYNSEGNLLDSWPLDFDAKALATGKKTVCALSANRRFIKNKEGINSLDSGEWIGIITDMQGRKSLLYREELISLD